MAYVLTMEGAHCRGVWGVFLTQERAEIAALVSIQEEPDDYHYFQVDAFEIDNRVDDPRSVSVFRRVGGKVYRADNSADTLHWHTPKASGDKTWHLVAEI